MSQAEDHSMDAPESPDISRRVEAATETEMPTEAPTQSRITTQTETTTETPPAAATEADTGAAGASAPLQADAPHAADEARRRAVRPWAIAGGCAVLLSVGAVSLSSTPLFDARTIRVSGTHHLGRGEVRRLIGADEDTNVVRFDTAHAERRLEADPWIAEATVTKTLPGTIEVTVVERTAVLVVPGVGGPMLVAADGEVLGPAGDTGLPMVGGTEDGPPPPAELVTVAARTAASMPSALLRDVATVVVLPDGVRLELRSGVQVLVGEPVDLLAKGQALQAVLAYAEREGRAVTSIDVRVPSAPTARLVSGMTATP